MAFGEAGTGGSSLHQQLPWGEQHIGELHCAQRVTIATIIALCASGHNIDEQKGEPAGLEGSPSGTAALFPCQRMERMLS